MSKVKVAAVQMRCAPTVEENLQHAEALVCEAAANGAQIILLPELWERPYFLYGGSQGGKDAAAGLFHPEV